MRMNTTTARHISAKIAELIEFASIFQSRYGKQYRLKPGSPAEAWDLHQAIIDQQADIARLLDSATLENPPRCSKPWWNWQETMDTGVVYQIAIESNHLIACCASFEAAPLADTSPAIYASQRAIAGLLHPSALLVAQGEPGYTRRAS
jgi:hypothetical protein